MQLSNDPAGRVARLTFTAMMALAWAAPSWEVRGAPIPASGNPSPPSTAPADDANRRQSAAELARMFRALELAEREIPRHTFDPPAIVNQVGHNPAKLFEWVRDNTRWIPYRGSLRGPAGVLMDRMGNSLDRSLLLADLLRLAGYKAQLAHATLGDDQARQVLSKVPVAANWRPASAQEPPSEADTRAMARRLGISEDQLVMQGRGSAVEAEGMGEKLIARVTEQAPQLLKALGGAPSQAGIEDRHARALADHWWLQYEEAGKWIDMDPLLGDAKPGSSLAPVSQTLALDASGALPTGAKLSHEVEIRVVGAQWKGGRVQEKVVLSHALRPSETIGQAITVAFVPDDGMKYDFLDNAEPTKALRGAMLNQKRWTPVLMIGKTVRTEQAILASGELLKAGAEDPADKLGRGIRGGFGGLGGGEEAPKAPNTHLVAVWVDYEVRAPGEAPRQTRREVFSLLPPNADAGQAVPLPAMDEGQRLERAMAFLGSIQLLALPCQVSSDFVTATMVRDVLANRDLLLSLIAGGDGEGARAQVEKYGKLRPPLGPLYGLALARHDWGPLADEACICSTNLMSYRTTVSFGRNGEVIARQGFDLVANPIAARPGAKSDEFALAIQQGVLDTNAEAAALKASGPVHNTGELYGASQAAGAKWVTLRKLDDPAWSSLKLPPAAVARMRAQVGAGQVVVAPAELPAESPASWWKVDPVTGQTLGTDAQGWGEATVDYGALMFHAILVGAVAWLVCIVATDGKSTGACACLGIVLGIAWAAKAVGLAAGVKMVLDRTALGLGAACGIGKLMESK
jgi:hypothetical protein